MCVVHWQMNSPNKQYFIYIFSSLRFFSLYQIYTPQNVNNWQEYLTVFTKYLGRSFTTFTCVIKRSSLEFPVSQKIGGLFYIFFKLFNFYNIYFFIIQHTWTYWMK